MKGQGVYSTVLDPTAMFAVGLMVGVIIGTPVGCNCATHEIRQDAAQHGAGTYQLDRETGEVRFVWREAVEL